MIVFLSIVVFYFVLTCIYFFIGTHTNTGGRRIQRQAEVEGQRKRTIMFVLVFVLGIMSVLVLVFVLVLVLIGILVIQRTRSQTNYTLPCAHTSPSEEEVVYRHGCWMA